MSNNAAGRAYQELLNAPNGKKIDDLFCHGGPVGYKDKIGAGVVAHQLRSILTDEHLEIKNGMWKIIKPCPDFNTRLILLNIKYSVIFLAILQVIAILIALSIGDLPEINIQLDPTIPSAR